MSDEKILLTAAEVAKLTGFAEGTIRHFVSQRRMEIRDSATPEHLKLVEEVYGPNPLEPQESIYGVGKRRAASS